MVTLPTGPRPLHPRLAPASKPLEHLYSHGIAFAFCPPGESRNGDTGKGEGCQLVPDVHDLQRLVYASGQ